MPSNTGLLGARIPWARVIAEGLVIVVSILLAFGIDAWWAERRERAEVQDILDGLRAEFSGNLELLQVRGERWESHLAQLGSMMALVEAGRDPTLEEARASVLVSLMATYTFDPGSGVREALIASGRLELIENLELRRRLVAWAGVVREVQDNELAMRAFTLEQITPYLAARGVLVGSPLFPWRAASEAEELAAYRAVFRDTEFFGLVGTRYSWLTGTVREYAEAVEFVAGVLELVEAEAARL